MTWKELYRMSMALGPGGSQLLMERCRAAIAASSNARLKLAISAERNASLYTLCAALDAHDEAAAEDALTGPDTTRPKER